jgi:hypothetical protein
MNDNDLLPKLIPLKGREEDFDGQHTSLYELEYYQSDDQTSTETIRFSIAIGNIGLGPLHIILGDEKTENGETIAPAKQRIYRDNGEFREVDVGFVEKHMHQDHGGHDFPHWHYNGLATLELLDQEDLVVAKSDKEGYCVVDVFKFQNLPNSPLTRQFSPAACENKNDVGLSVGWADYYRPEAEDQYIPIDKIKTGIYSIRFKINKTDLVQDLGDPVSIRILIDKEKKIAKPI